MQTSADQKHMTRIPERLKSPRHLPLAPTTLQRAVLAGDVILLYVARAARVKLDESFFDVKKCR